MKKFDRPCFTRTKGNGYGTINTYRSIYEKTAKAKQMEARRYSSTKRARTRS